MQIESIDERLKQTEVQARKQYLIKKLNKLGIHQSRDGRRLTDLSLYSLEWVHIQELNKVAETYADD